MTHILGESKTLCADDSFVNLTVYFDLKYIMKICRKRVVHSEHTYLYIQVVRKEMLHYLTLKNIK